MTTSLFNGGRLFGAQAQPKTPKVTGMQDSFAQGFYGVRPKPAPALAAPAAPVAGRPVMRAPVVAPTTAPANLAMAQPAPQAPATDFEAGFAQVASPATVVQPTAAPATVVPAVAPAASAPTTQPSDGGWAAAKVSGLVPTEGGGWITPEEASDIAAQKSGLVRTELQYSRAKAVKAEDWWAKDNDGRTAITNEFLAKMMPGRVVNPWEDARTEEDMLWRSGQGPIASDLLKRMTPLSGPGNPSKTYKEAMDRHQEKLQREQLLKQIWIEDTKTAPRQSVTLESLPEQSRWMFEAMSNDDRNVAIKKAEDGARAAALAYLESPSFGRAGTATMQATFNQRVEAEVREMIRTNPKYAKEKEVYNAINQRVEADRAARAQAYQNRTSLQRTAPGYAKKQAEKQRLLNQRFT